MNTLETIIDQIIQHDKDHPDHGVGSAAHDIHAATLRRLFREKGLVSDEPGQTAPHAKSRQNLMVVLGYVTRNP